MSLPATDPLTNATLVTLTSYSANWTQLVNSYQVNSGGCFQSAGGNGAAMWNADSFPNDQYAQCVLSGVGAVNIFLGPAVRMSNTGTLTEYALRVNLNGNQWQVIKFVSNTFTNLSGTNSGTFSTGDTLKIQVQGQSPNNVVTAFQNGTVLYSTTDSSAINSGSGGFAGSGTSSAAEIKTWQAGSASASTPLFMYSVRNVLYFI